jgi:hypothetical protein
MVMMRANAALFLFVLALNAQAHRVVHVIVALCDNVNQGIVPVPASLGNGQDTEKNLYWGAAYGVRSWFNKSKEWKRVHREATPTKEIKERIVWEHVTADIHLIADAYDGAFIEQATQDLLRYAGGHGASTLLVNGLDLSIGGGADLIAYCGHDGLMDFAPPPSVHPANLPSGQAGAKKRETVILACISKRYFHGPLKSTGVFPLLWTTGLMAPEAYTLDAALQGWVRNETPEQVRERAAQAYAQWQKCGIGAARKLLVSGW